MRNKNDGAGWRKGALGKFMPGAGVKPGDGWGNRADIGTSSKGCGKYTSDDVSFLTGKASDTPHGNDQLNGRDIMAEVEANQMPGGGPIKPRGGQS